MIRGIEYNNRLLLEVRGYVSIITHLHTYEIFRTKFWLSPELTENKIGDFHCTNIVLERGVNVWRSSNLVQRSIQTHRIIIAVQAESTG